MTPFEEWCRAVEALKDHVGEIALSNLRYDALHDRVERPIRAAFRERVGELHATPSGISPDLLIQKVAREQPATFFCQGPKPDFEQCSRVVPAQDFIHENVDLEAAGGWQVEDSIPEDYLDRLEEGLEGLATSTIPHDEFRHFAWVTRTGQLRELREGTPEDEIAIEARNRCGLLHHGGPVPIRFVEVEYPAAGIGAHLHAPTYLDGAPYVVYVSKAGPGDWGTALNVALICDGLSEAVHERIEFTANFRMRRLGWVTGKVDVEPSKILATMPMGWDGNYGALEDLYR
jgi:hypothetical protein